jgi:hypothetical protein
MTAATIPMTITDEAAARVKELGLQCELDQIIEHARQTLKGLRRLRVVLEDDPNWPKDDPLVTIWAIHEPIPPEKWTDLTAWHEWGKWMYETFPPQVLNYLHLTSVYGDDDGW